MLTAQVLVAKKQRLIPWDHQYWETHDQKLEGIVGWARAFYCVVGFGIASREGLSEVEKSLSS